MTAVEVQAEAIVLVIIIVAHVLGGIAKRYKVKPGGCIPDKVKKIIVHVKNIKDLSRDVIKEEKRPLEPKQHMSAYFIFLNKRRAALLGVNGLASDGVLESVGNKVNRAYILESFEKSNRSRKVDVHLSNGVLARAAVPSGASTGIYEALELRDGGSDYLGKGVSKAVSNVNSIIGPALIGKDPTDQTGLDNFMVQQLDGTQNEWGWCKQKLGANAILAVSLAVCKAGAAVLNIPLYKEFMILPVGAASFKEAMKMGVESVIKKKYGQDATNVGDEGGFAPNIQENKEGLELLKTAIAKAGYTGKNNDGSQKISGDQLKDVYKSFVAEYPIVSIEDPFDQDDWEHYAKMTAEIGTQVQIVGDDLLVTNPKVNQIGSVTESIEAVKMSKHAGWGVMASHRSGETEDTFIADLSVGLATLLRIEEELGSDAVYAGASFRAPVEPY
ncbi:hypothetical protein DH2020_026220 [Rehmannia glutinosa]|uniref:phosphopyruvate hydratase n=1 Tax=Rehmannia glutinosa TaxID=99300 RepID=A0ABR0VZA3_REHGL